MSLFQTDVDRQAKIMLAGGALIAAAIAYIAYGYLTSSSTHPSALSPIQTSQGASADESEHYSEVLQRYNRTNAAAARETGDSYLSAMSSRSEAVPSGSPQNQPPTPAAPALPPPPAPAAPATVPQQSAAVPAERIAEQLGAFVAEWTPAVHGKARVAELLPGGPGALPAAPGRSDTPPPTAPARRIVPAFMLVPAVLGTDIDTDEDSWVRARIPVGQYAGAVLHARGYRRHNNTVDVTFNFMEWQGRVYRVNAKAVDSDSMRTNLSGEVNNRYWSRIILPALALGLGRAGRLFEEADTQTSYTPLGGAIQTRSGTPSGRAIRGTIAGGAATEAGRVLQADAGQLPAKQILIAKSGTIGVQFLEPVLSTDDLEGAVRAAPDSDAAAPPAAPPPSPAAGRANTSDQRDHPGSNHP